MSTMLIQSETLENIADAIREKCGIDYQLTPADMVTEINAITIPTTEVVAKYITNSQPYTPAKVDLLNITLQDSGTLEIYIASSGINLASSEGYLTKNGTTVSKTFERNNGGTATNIYYSFAVAAGDNIIFRKNSSINANSHLAIIAILTKS